MDCANLTAAQVDEDRRLYRIDLIPETLRRTCIGRYRPNGWIPPT